MHRPPRRNGADRPTGLGPATLSSTRSPEKESRTLLEPTGPVGPVHWGSYPGDLLERVMSVLLFQERPTAWRRRPSQGDGGLDVGEPKSGGYHVFQIKGFTGSMTSSRRSQVRQSVERILDDSRLDRPVTGWSLVVPMDPTSEDEAWFRQLTGPAPFPCDWKGQLFWDSEAAKHAHVVDYYLRDGKARLKGSVRDLQHLLAQPGTPLRAADVGGKLEDLRAAINRDDPHYRYEFSTSATAPTVRQEPALVKTRAVQLNDGGWLSIDVVARYPQAIEDAPIGGSMQISIPADTNQAGSGSLQADLQAFLDFGRGLALPEGTIHDVVVRAPAGLAGEAPSGSAVLGPAYLTDFHPQDNRFQVVDATGMVIAETTVRMTAATGGPRGGVELAGVDAGGAFDVRIQLLPTQDEERRRARLTVSGRDFVGVPVRRLLPGLRVMEALRAPHELLWRPEFGPAILSRIPMPPEPVIQLPTGYLRLVEAMSLIQENTSIPIVMPEELASEEVRDILTTARLLRDGVVTATWNTGTLVLRPEAPDDALDAISPDGALLFDGYEWMVTIGQVSVPLGPCYRVFFHPRIAEVQALEDGSRRIVLEPAEGEKGRAEERLGLVPGSDELPG
jgi:hypothetical protein